MSGTPSSLRRLLPDPPVRHYTVFGGTNTWREWLQAWQWLTRNAPADAVPRYETAVATVCGCSQGVSFGAGRMALHVLMKALGLRPGDEVILPGFTCTVVPNALIYLGIKPVYVDIEPNTFNIDPEQVERVITPRTRAICAQHTFGLSCDIDRLRTIADRHGLTLIEDCAHSMGARFDDNRPHGSVGNAAIISSDRTKVINTHVGGCVVTSDALLADRLRQEQRKAPALNWLVSRRIAFSFLAEHALRHPRALWIGRPILGAMRRLGLLFQWRDEQMDAIPTAYPYPCRLPSAQAALGLTQLSSLAANLAHRRRLARWLETHLNWYGNRLVGHFDDQAWLRYSVLVNDRDEFVRRFGQRMDLGIWFPCVIFGRPDHTEAVCYRPGSCPLAERVARHIVNFPTHPRIPSDFLESLWHQHGSWLQDNILRP